MSHSTYVIETYKTKSDEYAWRCLASNGQIVAIGGESYTRKDSMMETLDNLQMGFQWASIVDIDEEDED
jgi:uncharacterized protein YegP (UPF0339 family)